MLSDSDDDDAPCEASGGGGDVTLGEVLRQTSDDLDALLRAVMVIEDEIEASFYEDDVSQDVYDILQELFDVARMIAGNGHQP